MTADTRLAALVGALRVVAANATKPSRWRTAWTAACPGCGDDTTCRAKTVGIVEDNTTITIDCTCPGMLT